MNVELEEELLDLRELVKILKQENKELRAGYAELNLPAPFTSIDVERFMNEFDAGKHPLSAADELALKKASERFPTLIKLQSKTRDQKPIQNL